MEIWKKIEGYENYEILITGKVRKGIKEMKPYLNHGEYLRIKLTNDSGRKAFYIHQLVARAFISNPNNLPELNHKDHNPLNNSVENIEWITHKDNCADNAKFRRKQKEISNGGYWN